MLKFLFVYPPSADPTTPPLGLARLMGAAKRYLGANANFRFEDENRRYVRYVIDMVLSGQLHEWLEEASKAPIPDEFRRHLESFRASVANISENLLQALGILRHKPLFLDIRRYSFAYEILNRAFQLYSLPYFPSLIGYSKANLTMDIRESRQIRQALTSARLNPYLNYFERRTGLLQGLDVLGISLVYSSQLLPALTLAQTAKKLQKSMLVLLGGPCASSLRDGLKDKFSDLVDFVIPGDGEAYLEYLSKSDQTISDRGHFIRMTEDYISAPPSQWFKAPDPCLDYSWAEMDEYLLPEPVLCLDITRGCYYKKCVFCAYGHRAANYRRMAVPEVVHLIITLGTRLGVKRFFFSVDVVDLPFLESLCEALLEADLDITYCLDARMEKGFADERLCTRLHESGCRAISFGMESASRKTLERMAKGTDSSLFSQIIHALTDARIHIQVHLIHGFPGEKPEDFQETVEFLEKHRDEITTAGASPFTLLKGSIMESMASRYGIQDHISIGDLSLDYEYESALEKGYPDFESFTGFLFSVFPAVGRLTGSTTDYLIYASHFSPAEMKQLLSRFSGVF